MDDRRFPILPRSLLPTERARLKRKIDTWSVKTNNAEALGVVFERLVQAFEFEWAWDVFGKISRHDKRTGKFTDNLLTVGELVGQYMPPEQVSHIYLAIEECLRERWSLHSAVLPMSCGFAKRPESLAWIPILRRLTQMIDRAGLDDNIEGALNQLVPFGNAHFFPFATDDYFRELISAFSDAAKRDKWTATVEERRGASNDHESRLDLIHEAIQAVQLSQHRGGAFAEATASLIQMNECSRLEPLLHQVPAFTGAEIRAFVAFFQNFELGNLQMINHEGAIRAFMDCYKALFDAGAKLDWMVAHSYHPLGHSALRLGLLGWWLQCTEHYIRAFIQSAQIDDLAWDLLCLADAMHDKRMAHCPDDFWRSFADLMPKPELKSTVLSRLAVRK